MIFSIVKITLILNLNINTICRSSRLEVFCKNVVPENFLKFTGKHLCQSLFFNKVAGLQPFKYLRWYGLLTQLYQKRGLWHRCFPVNFAKFLTTPFLTEHLWWLLLPILSKRLNTYWGFKNRKSDYVGLTNLSKQSSPI